MAQEDSFIRAAAMQADILTWCFLLLLFAVAFLYASVGHGGASGYLALAALFGMTALEMRSVALLLNCVVSLVAFVNYQRAGFFRWNLFLPFIVTSLPAAFIGASLSLNAQLYQKILGLLLLLPALRLAFLQEQPDGFTRRLPLAFALTIGAAIGFVSGLIGIGGGILLSPIILLLHWGNMKQTAAVSALFIFLNSITGIAGSFLQGSFDLHGAWFFFPIAAAGGMLGGYFGRSERDNRKLKMILASVLAIASLKLLMI
jgi:uncharacterized protein